MACPIHPFETSSLRSLTAETKAEEQVAARIGFFGPMTRKAVEMRSKITADAVQEVEDTLLPQRLDIVIQQTIQRNRGIVKDFLRDVYRTVGRRFVVEGFDRAEQKATPPQEESLTDQWFKRVDEWLQTQTAGEEITQISETTRKDIMGILNTAQEEGLGTEQMAQRLDDEIAGVNQQRGRVIARTETITSSNFASQEGAKASGLDKMKEWFDSDDNRVRDSHLAIDAKDPIPLNDKYSWVDPVSGKQRLADYPGDPSLPAAERVNCRCVELYTEPNS